MCSPRSCCPGTRAVTLHLGPTTGSPAPAAPVLHAASRTGGDLGPDLTWGAGPGCSAARASHVEATSRLPATGWVGTPSAPQFAELQTLPPQPAPPTPQWVRRGRPLIVPTGGKFQEEREWKGALQGPLTRPVPEPRAALFAGGRWGFPLLVISSGKRSWALWDACGIPCGMLTGPPSNQLGN